MTLNAIKSLCYSQTLLSSTELKDCLELIKKSDGPQIDKDGNYQEVGRMRRIIYLSLDRRLRSSSKISITRRETGLVDTLCNTALFDFSSTDDSSNGSKRERPQSASSTSKLTFSSMFIFFYILNNIFDIILEHMSQVLLNYFKQLHGEQSFSEIIFRMPLIIDSKIQLNDIFQKDIPIFDNNLKYNLLARFFFSKKIYIFIFKFSLTLIKADLDFFRRAIQLPIIEPLDENRLNKFLTITMNSILIALKYVYSAIQNDESITNDQILHDIGRICMKVGDIIKYSPRLENSRNVFLNYHLVITVMLTKGIKQILANIHNKQSNDTQQQQPKM